MTSKIGDYVSKYLQLRSKVEEIKKEHKEQLAPYNEAMDKLEEYFAKYMDDQGLANLKTDEGTAYTSDLMSVTTGDKVAFLDYVKAQDAWHLLDIRPSKSAVQELVENGTEPPPGVKISTHRKVNVRKN